MSFKLGDLVEAWGLKGVIKSISTNPLSYGILEVQFEGGYLNYFTNTGKSESWHKDVSLKFISRAAKEVEKEVEGFVIIDIGETNNLLTPIKFMYATEELARSYSGKNTVSVVKVKGAYKILEGN